MKELSNDYITDYILKRRFATANLYTFILKDGALDWFTDLDFNLHFENVIFKGNSLIIEGLYMRASVGLSVDEQDVKISFRPDDTLAGSNFVQAVSEGLLDGATIFRRKAFWKADNNVGMFDYSIPPTDAIPMFLGLVSTIEKIGRTQVDLKVRSPLSLLDTDMPRNNYQPGCQWILFSNPGCTVNADTYKVIGTVSALIGDYGITVGGGVTPFSIGADGDQYYAQGKIRFTSGDRENLELTIRGNSDTDIYFMYPPIVGLQVGDTFEMWPGCSKRVDTCLRKYNNKANHRGFDKVPPIHISA